MSERTAPHGACMENTWSASLIALQRTITQEWDVWFHLAALIFLLFFFFACLNKMIDLAMIDLWGETHNNQAVDWV